MPSAKTVLVLLALILLGLGVRLLGAEQVFRGPDIVLRGFDSYYHARRVVYTTVNFPDVLERDAYLNFPEGSAVPWPPLYDFLLGAVSRGLGGTPSVAERVAAVTPVLLGALGVVPAFLLASLFAGPRVGLLAAGLTAGLDAHAHFGRIGAADHHAMTSLLGAWLLVVSVLVLARRDEPPGRGRWTALIVLRVSVILTWPGSVMLLAVTESGLLLAALFEPDARARRGLLLGGATSTALTAGVLLPFALSASTTADYGVTPSYFSTFHPVLMATISLLFGGAAALDRMRPGSGPLPRLAVCVGLGALLAGGLLGSSPTLREGVEYGLRFLSSTHAAGQQVLEEKPLFFRTGSFDPSLAQAFYGYAVYLLPLVPLILLARWRDLRLRPSACLCLAWFLFFGMLSLSSIRFTNEFAALAPAGLALLAHAAWTRLRAHTALVPALFAAALCALLLLAPALEVHRERAARSLASARGAEPTPTLEFVMHRFAARVRLATPETAGYMDSTQTPDYGIFTWSGFGHILHHVARRPTPADNFGPVIGRDDRSFLLSTALFRYRRPERALAELERLKTPFVISAGFDWGPPEAFGNRLHRDDASGRGGRRAISGLRLILESEPSPGVYSPGFKLFERVRGARIEIQATPGAILLARLPIETNTGRRFLWTDRVEADAHGVLALRVPYATENGPQPTHTNGRLEIQLDEEVWPALRVLESEVRNGTRLRIEHGRR